MSGILMCSLGGVWGKNTATVSGGLVLWVEGVGFRV